MDTPSISKCSTEFTDNKDAKDNKENADHKDNKDGEDGMESNKACTVRTVMEIAEDVRIPKIIIVPLEEEVLVEAVTAAVVAVVAVAAAAAAIAAVVVIVVGVVVVFSCCCCVRLNPGGQQPQPKRQWGPSVRLHLIVGLFFSWVTVIFTYDFLVYALTLSVYPRKTVSPNKLETGLRPNSAGIPYT